MAGRGSWAVATVGLLLLQPCGGAEAGLLYMNHYTGTPSCSFGGVGEVLRVSVLAAGATPCAAGPGGRYRLVNLTSDGSRVTALRINCTDASCASCEYTTGPAPLSAPLETCFFLYAGPGAPKGRSASASLYNASRGACLGSIDREPDRAHGVVSAEFKGNANCSAPAAEDSGDAVVLQHWSGLGPTPKCVAEAEAGGGRSEPLYANLTVRESTNVTGWLGCNATCAQDSCESSFGPVRFTECAALQGDRGGSVRFLDAATLFPCAGFGPAPSPPSPPPGRNVSYTVAVIGGTLGGFAIVWIVASMLLCRGGDRRSRPRSVQGGDVDVDAASPLIGGGTPASPSYSAVAIDG